MKRLYRNIRHILPMLLMIAATTACSALHSASSSDDGNKAEDYVSDGFTTTRKDHDTRAISRLVVKENEIVQYANILQYLEGRVPGVEVTSSGEVYVRGIGDIHREQPLFVVDGASVFSIEDINPNDVATIDVLKGPSATIYGERGVFGVIVITTKRAEAPKESKPSLKVNVNSSVSF